jgi:hypothetical protein
MVFLKSEDFQCECREFAYDANEYKRIREIRPHLHLRAGASVRAIRVPNRPVCQATLRRLRDCILKSFWTRITRILRIHTKKLFLIRVIREIRVQNGFLP